MSRQPEHTPGVVGDQAVEGLRASGGQQRDHTPDVVGGQATDDQQIADDEDRKQEQIEDDENTTEDKNENVEIRPPKDTAVNIHDGAVEEESRVIRLAKDLTQLTNITSLSKYTTTITNCALPQRSNISIIAKKNLKTTAM